MEAEYKLVTTLRVSKISGAGAACFAGFTDKTFTIDEFSAALYPYSAEQKRPSLHEPFFKTDRLKARLLSARFNTDCIHKYTRHKQPTGRYIHNLLTD